MISSEIAPSGIVATNEQISEEKITVQSRIAVNKSCYTWQEDIANSVTHGIGILLSVAGLLYLLMLAEHAYSAIALTIYGVSSIALYTASTAYHFVQQPIIKHRFRLLDHGSIYLLIAGSYTPYLTLGISSTSGTITLASVWCVALMGMAFKLFSPNPLRYEKYSLASYIGLGWAILFILPEMLTTVAPAVISWLLIGGLSYMIGILFYKWETLPYNHAIWHLFVLAGSICHFFSILTLLTPAS